MVILAPFYIGGVFLFSYGYELYNLPKALRLTAIVVFLTLAAVIIVAVLLLTLGAAGGNRESRSSRSSRSTSASSSGGGSSWGGPWPWPIFLGGLGGFGGPRQTITREVIREVPAAPVEPPPPQPVQCPYCGSSYLPAEHNFACPNCGAPAPETSPQMSTAN